MSQPIPNDPPATDAGPKFPDVVVQLVGQNGNVFNLVAIVARALRDAGHGDAVDEFTAEVFGADSYDQALAIMMNTVTVQ